MALLRAFQRMPSTGNSTLACEMGVYGVLPTLNYRALTWFYGDITEFGRQTVVHELLFLAVTLSGNAATAFFAIVAASCMRLCLI